MMLEPMEKLKAQVERLTEYPPEPENDFTAGVQHASKGIFKEIERVNAELVSHWEILISSRNTLNSRVDQLECQLREVKAERDELKKQVEDFQVALDVEDIDDLYEEMKEAKKERDIQEKAASYWKSRAIQQEYEAEVLKGQRKEGGNKYDAPETFAARVGMAVLEMWTRDLEREAAE